MSNKKIAFYINTMAGGGTERITLNLAKGMADRGYSIDLILLSPTGELLQQVPDNVHIVNVERPTKLWARIRTLIMYFRQNSPAVIYCSIYPRGFDTLIAKWSTLSSVKVMIGMHMHESLNLAKGLSLRDQIKIFFGRFASKIIPVSHGVAEDQINNFHIPRHKVHVIYNPIVTDQLKLNMNKAVAHDWLRGKTLPIVLAAGRFVPQKDFMTLLHAFRQVISQTPAKLIILGEGKDRQMLESLIQELDLSEHVDMPGFVDNPFTYMKSADLFVLSSRHEGFGNVIAEALACGCPVVSTDCPSGPAEILNNGEYGALVPVGDSEALGQAIIESLQREHDRSKLQQRAEDFSEDKIIEEYLEVFGLL